MDTTDESGAMWGAVFGALPSIVSAVSGLFGNHKRDLVDVIARDQLIASEMLRRGLDYEGLVARADPTGEEAGAFIASIVSAMSDASNKRDYNPELFTRDLNEMFARELEARDVQDPESGAFLGALLKAVPGIFSSLSSLFSHKREFNEDLLARDFQEIYARELQARGVEADPESGAFLPLFLSIVPAIAGLFKHKREFDESLFARDFDELIARADTSNDESGAFIAALLRAAPTIVSAIGNIFNGRKREFDELLARGDIDEQFIRELVARADAGDDESGAFLGLLRFIPNIISVISGKHKREFEDVLFARGLSSLNDLD